MTTKYKLSKEKIVADGHNHAYTANAKAFKRIDVLSVPEKLVPDASGTAQNVGKGNLLRIEGTLGGFINFGSDASVTAVGNEDTSVKTPADFFMIVATDDFIKTSAAMRIEVIKD